jgi:anti-sigma factor RsiW
MMEHAELPQWLDLDLDGELPPSQRALLAEHLIACAACRDERRAQESVRARLLGGRIDVQHDFQRRVMAALPAAGWESRPARAWLVPAALAVGLLAGAALLLGGGGLAAPGAVVGTAAALTDLFLAALLAGAGLLAASWRGLGMAVADLFAGSLASVFAFGAGVLFLNLILLRLLRRRPRRAEAWRGSPGRRLR